MKEIKRLISMFFLLFGLTITLLRADTTTPTVVSIGLDQTSSKGYHLLKGNELIFAVEFTEAVSVMGTPELYFVVGNQKYTAYYTKGTGSKVLLFKYIVPAEGMTLTNLNINANSIYLINANSTYRYNDPNDTEITNSDMPTELTTSYLDQTISGFVKKYGPNKSVNLEIDWFESPTTTDYILVDKDTISLSGVGLNFAFFINTENGWTLRVSDATVKITSTFKDNQWDFNLTSIDSSSLRETVNRLGSRHNPTALSDFLKDFNNSNLMNAINTAWKTSGVTNTLFKTLSQETIEHSAVSFPNSDGDMFLDIIDSCPNEYGNQSNGCPVPVITDVIVPIAGFNGDVSIPQSVKPIELDNGTNQFNIENKNSNTVVNIPPEDSDKKEVDITISSNGSDTKIFAPKDAKFSVKADGSVTQSMRVEDTKIEINAKNSGEIEIKKETKEVNKVVSLPAGANINMADDSSVLGITEVVADVKNIEKPIEIKAEAKPNNELQVITIVENIEYSLSTREESYEAKMELIEKSSNQRGDKTIYSGIKSTFKSKKTFKVIEDSKLRDEISGSNVEIFPTTQWQKFEEKQYFDGRRTITLLMGSSKIIKDGIEEEMIKGIEYELVPYSQIYTTTNQESSNVVANGSNTLIPIYNSDSYLNIQKGWNLLSNPRAKPLNVITAFKYAINSFKYDSGWIQEPKTLNQNEGIWINYPKHISEKIVGDSYYSEFTNVQSGWNLFGAGRDISLNELNQFSEVWAYNSKDKEWVKNPSIIYRGYGFWVK